MIRRIRAAVLGVWLLVPERDSLLGCALEYLLMAVILAVCVVAIASGVGR